MLLLLGWSAWALTLDEALRQAEDNNPAIVMARADLSAARGGLLSAQAVWDPAFSSGVNTASSSQQGRFQGVPTLFESASTGWDAALAQSLPSGTAWQLSWDNNRTTQSGSFAGVEIEEALTWQSQLQLSLTQQLLKGHRLSYNLRTVQAARAALTTTEAALLAQRQQVLSAVAGAYWDLAYAQAGLQVADEAVAVAEEERRIVAALVDSGSLAPVELTRVDAALAQARMSRIDAEVGLRAASDVLALLLGEAPGAALSADTPVTDLPLGLSVAEEEAVRVALAQNPSLQSLRLTMSEAERTLRNAQHAQLPSLALTGNVGLLGFDDTDEGGDEPTYSAAVQEMLSGDYTNTYVGLDFSMPLLSRAERGQVQAETANLSRARTALEAEERSVAQQVAAAVRELESAQRKVTLAELNLRLAEETLAAEKARQAVGRAIEKDVLAAQQARDQAEVDLVGTRVSAQKALVSLQALQGLL